MTTPGGGSGGHYSHIPTGEKPQCMSSDSGSHSSSPVRLPDWNIDYAECSAQSYLPPAHRIDDRPVFSFNSSENPGSQSHPLSVRPMILLPSGKLILVPESETANNALLHLLDCSTSEPSTGQFNLPGTLWVNILPTIPTVSSSTGPPNPADTAIVPIMPTPLASVRLPPKLKQPKYISQTSANSFRVQVNAGIRSARNKKFSRNVSSLEDALWLCEYALIMSGNYSSLEEIVAKGNFECMVQREMVHSLDNFVSKLDSNVSYLEQRGVLKQSECDIVTDFLKRISPSNEQSGEQHITGVKRTAEMHSDTVQSEELLSKVIPRRGVVQFVVVDSVNKSSST
mmetsp:Transcript_16177/g.24380  ORF Transcript_16177/g.24380 Transcript_16177/m.24380 type:complete len:341 (-) Transcript_16177:669-1691(-)|eukprot:CAMPEP_0185020388 /NCGR_PEP_ID=MMETSP1103-20130426/2991_1 /TAXON_ID=36769 /ORGANISM="Paraphysomonas bandaiensis, Strain Caron Lab Isolate" /LENGTH=340 /DNA_ID=CAMNT_0027551257 /DNA_START=131 /DNA_END=1153 /DNA_ORIENTATION=-